MRTTLDEKLTQHGLIAGTALTHEYKWQSGQARQFDLGRFANRQAYWRELLKTSSFHKKKIVVNNYNALFYNDTYSPAGRLFRKLLDFLVSIGFEINIRRDVCDYKRIEADADFSELNQIQLRDNNIILSELEKNGVNTEEYFLLTDENERELLRALQFYLESNVEQELTAEPVLDIVYGFNARLTPENIQALAELGARGAYKKIRYEQQYSPDSKSKQPYTFTWENNYDAQTLSALLPQLKQGIFIEADQVLSNAKEISLQDTCTTELDLAAFQKLEKAKLTLGKLQTISGLDRLTQLQELQIGPAAFDVLPLAQLSNLRKLTFDTGNKVDLENILKDCNKLEELELNIYQPYAARLPLLPELKKIHIISYEPIAGLQNLPKLEILKLSPVADLNLTNLDKVKKLKITRGGTQLKSISGYLPNLQSLQMTDVDFDMDDIRKFCDPKKLTKLKLHNNSKLKKLFFDGLELEELTLDSIDQLTELDLEQFPNLKKLKICGCNKLEKLKNLACSQLEEITIEDCSELSSFFLTDCPNVKSITIANSPKCQVVNNLGAPNKLETLKIVGYESELVIDLTHLAELRSLSLQEINCQKIINLDSCPALERLEIDFVTGLTDLFLTNHPRLKSLEIDHCDNLETIDGLKSLQSLNRVNISHCPKFKVDEEALENIPTVKVNETPDKKFASLAAQARSAFTFQLDKALSCSLQERYQPLPFTKQKDYKTRPEHLRQVENLAVESIHVPKKLRVHKDHTDAKLKLPVGKVSPDGIVLKGDEKGSHPGLTKMPSRPEPLKSDYETYISPDKEIEVQKVFTSNDGHDPHQAKYRVFIYDHVSLDANDNIVLEPAEIDPKKATPVTFKPYASQLNFQTATHEIALAPDENYLILPGLSANDELLAASHQDIFEYRYHAATNQYLAVLKPGVDRKDLPNALQYKIVKNANYERHYLMKQDIIARDAPVPQLPTKLKGALDKYFTTHPEFSQLEFLPPHVQVNRLAQFCRDKFKNEAFSDNKEGIAAFIKQLDEPKGSCRHRALTFMVLAQYLNIPARIVRNYCHRFDEVAIRKQQDYEYVGIDVGGSQARLKEKPIPKFVTPPITKPTPAKANPVPVQPSKPVDMTKPDKKNDDWQQYFLEEELWLESCNNLSDVVKKMLAEPGPYLLRTQQHEKTTDYYANIWALLKQNNVASVYITSADEIESYFETEKINATKDNKEKLFSRIDGPLKKLLQKKQGVILIDWSQFSATERAIYKSIFDDPPSLHGKRLPSDIKVIGLLPKMIPANGVFVSRPLQLTLPTHYVQTRKPDELDDVHQIKINLYENPDWEQFLLPKMIIQGDEMIIKKSKFFQALEKGQQVKLINPPKNNPAFQQMLARLRTEREIYFNGETVTAHANFKVQTKETPIKIDLPDNVHLSYDERQNDNKKYYLTRDNFTELFKRYHVDEQDCIYTLDGILKEYKNGDEIVVTDQLSAGEWQQFIDKIKKISAKKTCQFNIQVKSDVPAILQNSIASNKQPEVFRDFVFANSAPFNTHIVSNDPSFMLPALKIEFNIDDQNVFHTNNDDMWGDLVEQTDLQLQQGKIRAKRLPAEFWQKIQAGETVILAGDLSEQDYHALQSIFSQKPHLYVNGKREQLEGGLIWVHQLQSYKTNDYYQYQFTVNTNFYSELLSQEKENLNLHVLQHVNRYVDYIKKTTPVSYEKFKAMYEYGVQAHAKENPLKPIFQHHFQKGTEEYAYFNVMAKICFANHRADYLARDKKLLNLLQHVHTDADFDKYFWQITNCLSGKFLQELNLLIAFDNQTRKPPLPTQAAKDAVLGFISEMLSDVKHEAWASTARMPEYSLFQAALKVAPKESADDKQQHELWQTLQQDDKPILYLIGTPGTGKTYTAKLTRDLHQDDVTLFSGEEQIIAWLLSEAPGKKILLLDEANLEKTGKWEFLRGLKDVPPGVYYKNKFYPLTKDHKVIATGNPNHYSGRYFHPILYDCAHLLWFGPYRKSFIEKQTKKYFMQFAQHATVLNDADFVKARDLISEYYDILRAQPKFNEEISLRDIENVCARASLIKTKNPQENWQTAAACALYDEFGFSFQDDTARKTFKNDLKKYGLKNLPFHAPEMLGQDFVLAPKVKKIFRIFVDDFTLRSERVRRNENSPGKLGLLLEGLSGIGKSTFYVEALQQLGFSEDAKDPQKRFYQITAGSMNVLATLLKAFHEGSVVILDEVNLDKKLLKVLNQLLTGRDLNDKPAKKAGFMVLATQNPAFFAGCSAHCRALSNRFRKNKYDYMKKDLIYVAEKKSHPQPKPFVDTFFKIKTGHPEKNVRTFFKALKASLRVR